MNNKWSFKLNEFMEWVRKEFPTPLKEHFTYDLLENTIAWFAIRCNTVEEFLISITCVIPEVTREEWEMFLS